MNNISFKAKIFGINNPDLQHDFEQATKEDYVHSLYFAKDPDTGLDILVLHKYGEPSAKHLNTSIIKKGCDYTLEQILKLFNILKIREALNHVETRKRYKLEHDFDDNYVRLDAPKEPVVVIPKDKLKKKYAKEKKLTHEEKNKMIISVLEKAGKLETPQQMAKLAKYIKDFE